MPAAARLGDQAKCDSDAHGCPSCPHTVKGPAILGSADVIVNNMPAIRQDDMGIHAACCGGNTWTAAKGSGTVFINGKAAMRKGDQTTHCGGVGKFIEGSGDVVIGG